MTKQLLEGSEVLCIPILITAYGYYLGQLHQSMQDIAGIILFVMGAIGAALSLFTYYAFKQFPKINSHLFRIVWGGLGCVISFSAIVVYAMMFK